MLQLESITKSYTTGEFTQTALNGVSIDFRDNEFVAILGPSGSGKTTMLNIIGGLDHYDSGDLIIDGVSTKEYKDGDWDIYRNNRVGFIFQSYNLIPHQNVLANVELALTLSGVSKEERKRRALEALDAVGLAEHANKKPNQLSGGQAQRVAIARALVNNPTIVLADEPTGALDSNTSVDVMNLLQDIAKDHLVVMVTHNPELAHQYANRIVEIHDGSITSDSHPFDPSTEVAPEPKPTRRTAMSFLTALSLSAQNLISKKGRTIMTAFAGSIGIIGIALILALSTGATNYINSIEEETLSEYPISITSSSLSITSMLSSYYSTDGSSGDASNSEDEAESEDEDSASTSVNVTKMISSLATGFGNNDLASLKEFLDNNGGNINDYASAIEYTYDVTPLIYAQNPSGTWQQVNPDTTTSSYTTSSYSSSIYSSSTNVFESLPENSSLYENSYDVVAGHWPENSSEAVLVLSSDGSISDYLLYDLGLRDVSERDEMVSSVMDGTGSDGVYDYGTYTYDDLLGITFKVVDVVDTYAYDETYGVWTDKSDDAEYMESVIENSDDLTIVGIVIPAEDANATMLSTGIYYTYDLIAETVTYATESEIVQQQLANPDIDVLTGEPFGEDDDDSLDLSQIVAVDSNAIENAFSFDTSGLTVDTSALSSIISTENLTQILADSLSEEAIAELTASAAEDEELLNTLSSVLENAMNAYLAAYALDDTLTPEVYFAEGGEGYALLQEALGDSNVLAESALAAAMTEIASTIVDEVSTQITEGVQEMIASLVNQLPSSISVDANAIASAFTITMTSEDLADVITSLMTSSDRTYEDNLSTFNYADLTSPTQIDIYPKDFESKEVIVEILDQYNADAVAAGEDDRVITYTDLVGTLMSSVTDIIDVISYLLIAFVSISLVVSSIMIGIITYISVLERKKEIGVLRACGARKRDIRRVFNAETFIEGLLAGLIGVGLTALACIPVSSIIYNLYGVSNIATLPLSSAVILVVLSVLLTTISGLIPASSAANADPVEALRSE